MKNFILILTLLFSQIVFGQDLKLYQLSPILNSQLASNDVTLVSDISAGQSKKLSIGELDLRWGFATMSPLNLSSNILSIPAATSSVHGYLSSNDWTTFNAKQSTVSATSPIVFSANNISIPAATSSVHGYLSSNDWTTFNAKVGTSTVQTLTNKDIDGGTASNTSRITLPKDTKTNLDLLTRKAGTIVYDTTSNKPYYDNGTVLTAVGSGSGGGKNYIAGGDAESGTTGFATYSDASGTAPVDGTGGTASITWATSATTPLENLNSFIFTKGATNRQGDGVSYPFTIDLQDRAKVLKISFSYLVNSGTFAAASTSTASDVTVWIYDVTNGVLIQPSSSNLLSNSTTIPDKFSATFQTAGNSSSYRLIWHVGSTSASAYSLKIDDVKVEPSQYVYGTPITDWVSYTPTWTSSGSPSIGNGTLTGRWRKVGDTMEVMIDLTFGATTSGAGNNWLFGLPSGYFVDSTKTPSNLGAGGAILLDSGTAYYGAVPMIVGSGFRVTPSAASGSQVGATVPFTWATGDNLNFTAAIPILGWSSSVQMSDTNESKQIVFLGQSTGVSATANVTNIPFTTVKDSLGTAWNGSVYTVQTPGDYTVSTYIYGGSTCTMYIYLNGSVHRAIAYSVGSSGGAGTLLIPNLKSGDTIALRSNVTQAFSASSDQYLSIFRHAGPQTISATDTIAASYQTGAGQAIAGGTITVVDFGTKIDDSNSWVTTGASWKFQPQTSGRFKVCSYVKYASGSWTNTSYMRLAVYKSGNLYRYLQEMVLPSTGTYSPPMVGGCTYLRLLTTEYIDIRTSQNEGARSLNTTAESNYVDIMRVGNY